MTQIYKVSKLKETKGKVELVEVARIVASRFEFSADLGPPLFGGQPGNLLFYRDETKLFSKKPVLAAFLPGTDWVVTETV